MDERPDCQGLQFPTVVADSKLAFEMFGRFLSVLPCDTRSLYYFFVISLGPGFNKKEYWAVQVDMIVVRKNARTQRETESTRHARCMIESCNQRTRKRVIDHVLSLPSSVLVSCRRCCPEMSWSEPGLRLDLLDRGGAVLHVSRPFASLNGFLGEQPLHVVA